MAFSLKTRHFSKISAFGKNRSFRDFCDYQLSVVLLSNVVYCPTFFDESASHHR